MDQYFINKTVERRALNNLCKFNYEKYKNAKLSDKPDIQNNNPSVGVEVTIEEFNEVIMNTRFVGKNIIRVLKMKRKTSVKFSAIQILKEFPKKHEIIRKFLSNHPVYEDKDGKVVFINNFSKLLRTPENSDIYFVEKPLLRTLNSEGIVQFPPATAQWVGSLPNKLLDRLKKKEKKMVGYDQFDEMNLYIKCFTASIEEIKEFEELAKKYHSEYNCKFKNIYLENHESSGIKYVVTL